jgi:hypothetical protein
MPDTVINRNLLSNPYERFLDRTIEKARPPTPVVILPPPRPARAVDAPKPGPKTPLMAPEDLEIIKARPVKAGRRGSVRIVQVIALVSKVTNLSVSEIIGPSKKQPLVRTRFVAVWLCRRFTGLSTTRIAKGFGGRDHTTIVNAIQQVDRVIRVHKIRPADDSLAGWMPALLKALDAHVPQPEAKRVKNLLPLPALGEQTQATRRGPGRPRKACEDVPLQELVRRSLLGGRAGGKGQRQGAGALQASDPGVSANAEEAA